MFPNVRLLIGAFVASVVALSCGFGLFAAFRVNHEPLSQLPVGTSPVRFVANEAAVPRTGWGTPFDGQSRASALPRGEAATEIPRATPVSQSKAEALSPATVGAIKPVAAGDATQRAVEQPVAAIPSATPIIAAAPPTEIAQPAVAPQPAVTAPAAIVAVTAPPVSKSGEQTTSMALGAVNSTDKTAPAPSTSALPPAPADSVANPASDAPDQTASVPTPSVDAPSPATATPSPDAVPAPAAGVAPATRSSPPQSPVAHSAAVTPAAAATPDAGVESKAAEAPGPAIATATPDQSAAVKPPGEQAEPAKAVIAPVKKAVRKPVARRRIAVRKRIVRRWRARATVRNSGFGDPVFQSAPGFSGASASRGSNSSSWSNGQ